MKKSLQILMLVALFSLTGGLLRAQNGVPTTCTPITDVTTSEITPYAAKVTAKTGLPYTDNITQGGDSLKDGYGRSSQNTIRVVHRYTPAELVPYDGGYLTKISFIPTATTMASTYTLVVYTGGSSSGTSTFNQGTQATTQTIVRSSLVNNEWNEITLTTPIKIDASKELWIGYIAQAGNNVKTAGYDFGPQKAGQGNLIYYSNAWRLLTTAGSSLTYNWCIKGTVVKKNVIVELGDPGFIPGTGAKTTYSQTQVGDSLLSHTFSGLMMNTTYEYYLQKECIGDNSVVGPYTFTTLDDDWCTDSFEDYTVGNMVASEAALGDNAACWRTWTGPAGSTEDAVVTTEQVFHGSKAAKFIYRNDMVFLLGEKTDGSFVVEFNMYVPSGRGGYFSLLHHMNTPSTAERGCEITISTGSTASLKVRNSNYSFTFPHNQWVPVKFDINLAKDSIQMTVNGISVRKWRFSDQSVSTATGTKKLFGINFYPNSSTSVFYIDAINLPQPGTKANPLTIDNVQDLVDFRTAVNSSTGSYKGVSATSGLGSGFQGKYFVITDNLDLSSVCGPGIGNWLPIGSTTNLAFKGTLNGQGHVISNLYINATTSDNQGFFGYIIGGTVENLNLENGSINARNTVGGLCAALQSQSTIKNVTNGMTVEGNRDVGGFVGSLSSNASLYSVTNTGAITARSASNSRVGGIVGMYASGSIDGAVNSGLISSPNNAGGIIGYINTGTNRLSNAINTGMISCSGFYKGAVIGRAAAAITVTNCYYDKQIYTGTEANGTGKLTKELTGTGLQGLLGVDANWEYQNNSYPSLSGTVQSNVSKLASAPFFLKDTGNYETIDGVLNDIGLNTLNNVSWSSTTPSFITINGNQASLSCTSTLTDVNLSANLENNVKEYTLINRRLTRTSSHSITLCSNQLPYQYNDTTFIYGAGDTTIIFSTSYGCDSAVTVSVTVHQVPDITIVGNSTPCYGTDVELIAQSTDPNDTYLWNTLETTDTVHLLTLQRDTTISIVASNDHNGLICVAYDTLNISLYPIYSHEDTVLVCAAQLPYTYGNTSVQFTDSGLQAPIILQSVNGCDSVLNVFMHIYYDTKVKDTIVLCANELPLTYYDSIFDVNTTTGDYVIPMQNATGCDTIYLLNLVVNPIPTATIAPTPDTIFIGDDLFLSILTSDIFQWSTGETASAIRVTPNMQGINSYYAYLSNAQGCVDTLRRDVFVEVCGAGYPATDIENNSYETHFYGRTCWMVENLRSTLYADGQPIPGVMEYTSSVYPDAAHNVSIFGRLYDWYSATRTAPEQTPDSTLLVQGVCPDGWRLPTYYEYIELMQNLGYSLADLRSTNYWLDNAGNNSSNFNMRPAGYFDNAANQFVNLHGNTYFITMTTILTETTTFEAFSCGYNCPDLVRYMADKTNGYSIRCVKSIRNQPQPN